MDPTDKIMEIIHEGAPDTLSRIAAVLGIKEATLAAQPSVPMPPTPEMIKAFQEGFLAELHKNDKRRTMTAEEAGLRAMLKAAPTPSADEPTITITENGGVQINTRNPEVADKLFALIDQFRAARPAAGQPSLPEGWEWVAPGLAKPPPGFIANAHAAAGQAQHRNEGFERDHQKAVRAIEVAEIPEIQGLSPENAISTLAYMLGQAQQDDESWDLSHPDKSYTMTVYSLGHVEHFKTLGWQLIEHQDAEKVDLVSYRVVADTAHRMLGSEKYERFMDAIDAARAQQGGQS